MFINISYAMTYFIFDKVETHICSGTKRMLKSNEENIFYYIIQLFSSKNAFVSFQHSFLGWYEIIIRVRTPIETEGP